MPALEWRKGVARIEIIEQVLDLLAQFPEGMPRPLGSDPGAPASAFKGGVFESSGEKLSRLPSGAAQTEVNPTVEGAAGTRKTGYSPVAPVIG